MAGRQPGAPITRVVVDRGWVVPGTWPWVVPAVAQVLEEGLDLDPGVSVLVGANGSGKSTIVEGIAGAWARRMTSVRSDWIQRVTGEASDEDSPLDRAFRLTTTSGGPNGGLFLRAERLHAQADLFSKRGRWSERIADTPLLERSHGEGFLAVLSGMTVEPGFYVLDEPESALSFESSLALLQILGDLVAGGSQVLLATHSPVLAAMPGARLLQLGEHGIEQVAYDDTDLVQGWRAFLDDPGRFLRHLG